MKNKDKICSVPPCTSPVSSRGQCEAHYQRYRRGNWVSILFDTTECPELDPYRSRNSGRRTAGPVGRYRNAHKRIESIRGPASAYQCQECSAPAQEWALDPDAVCVVQETIGQKAGWWFSTDVNEYTALCCKHHRLQDAAVCR